MVDSRCEMCFQNEKWVNRRVRPVVELFEFVLARMLHCPCTLSSLVCCLVLNDVRDVRLRSALLFWVLWDRTGGLTV